MHNIGLNKDLEGFQKISKVINSFSLLEATIHFDLLFKSSSVATLIDKVVVVGSFEDLDKAYDMSGVLYF